VLTLIGCRSKARGMTLLLEVIIGLGIFSVSILLIFGLFASSQKATASAKNLAVAADLAKEVMETELSKGYDGVGPSSVDIPMPTTVDGVATTTVYKTEVEVNEVIEKAPFDFPRKRILVTVSWDEVTGMKGRKTQLETILVQ
jgi:type II secretory pathway pseudopilin PulG